MSQASPFQRYEKAVEGWRGNLAISNLPRENKFQYFKPMALAIGTDN
ncbi:MAG: hypothetical protein F6K54_26865 [Okeania sp. SIO3B5]|nr:hypothetical protein [Okeania sp. SIO3B5]NEO56387.1 hypothetical protein [Okeania sp. SIO3B5]